MRVHDQPTRLAGQTSIHDRTGGQPVNQSASQAGITWRYVEAPESYNEFNITRIFLCNGSSRGESAIR